MKQVFLDFMFVQLFIVFKCNRPMVSFTLPWWEMGGTWGKAEG